MVAAKLRFSMVLRRSSLRHHGRHALFVLVGIALLAYPLDWAFWRLRVAAGGGMGVANVNSITAATLKGNHFEVYSQETTQVQCTLSLLPQAGTSPCWWVRRHPQQITQY